MMKEAKITCICKTYEIKDLGLDLVSGDVVHIEAEKARTSRDLDVAKWAKGVRVEYVQRTKNVKKKVPEVVRHAFGAIPSPPPNPKPKQTSREVEMSSEVKAQTAEIQGLKAQLAEFQAILLGALKDIPGTQQVASVAPTAGTVVEETDDPSRVFVPSKLVDDTVKVKAKAKKKRTKSKGVADATSALREARKKE